MKIQILKKIEHCIDGYTPVIFDGTDLNIDVPDNSISEILMIDSIENIPYNKIDQILMSIKKLLRLNGTIALNGIDINCISRDLINRTIDCKVYNEVIFSKNGIYDSKELCNKLTEIGLSINKVSLRGSVYEIRATRVR